MLSFNVWNLIVMLMLIWPAAVRGQTGQAGQTLELGESQLHGKQDQPEAITFVTRQALPITETRSDTKLSQKIGGEISRDTFKNYL